MMNRALLQRLSDVMDAGQEAVLCIIVEESGSTPRGRGAAMIVFSDGSIEGTIGGGVAEHNVIKKALTMLKNGEETSLHKESMSSEAAALEGSICGGEISVFLERYGRAAEIVIFGAGHLGKALARLADAAGFRVITWDEREEFANPQNIPWGRTLSCSVHDILNEDGIKLHSSSYVVIVTRGHASDSDMVKILEGTPCAYIGMIGSRRKIAYVRERLLNDGVSAEHLDRIYQPIGLPIKAETPEEIAVCILAEIIAVRRGADVKGLREANGANS